MWSIKEETIEPDHVWKTFQKPEYNDVRIVVSRQQRYDTDDVLWIQAREESSPSCWRDVSPPFELRKEVAKMILELS